MTQCSNFNYKSKKRHVKKTGSKGVCSKNNHREIQHICRVFSKSEHDFYMNVNQFNAFLMPQNK